MAEIETAQERPAQRISEPTHITEETTDITGKVIEWKEMLSAATHAALVEREAKQLMAADDPTFEPFVDTPAKMGWHHGLTAATHAALAGYEAAQFDVVAAESSEATQSEVATAESSDAAESPVILDWRQPRTSATHAALAEIEAHQSAPSEEATPSAVAQRLDLPEETTSVTNDASALELEPEGLEPEGLEPEGLVGAAIVGAALAGGAVAASAFSSEEKEENEESAASIVAIVDDSADMSWREALKVETEARLASWMAPASAETPPVALKAELGVVEDKEEPKVATSHTITPATAVTSVLHADEPTFAAPVAQREDVVPDSRRRRRVGKRWVEELRFDTEISLAEIRSAQRKSEEAKSLATLPRTPLVAEEAQPISRPPLEVMPDATAVTPFAEIQPAQDTTAQEKQAEVTTSPSESELEGAAPAWVSALYLQTNKKLSNFAWTAKLNEANQAELATLDTPSVAWVDKLDEASQAELAAFDTPSATWVDKLDEASQAEVAALDTISATWVDKLDEASQAEVAALGTPPTWVAGLRTETNAYLAKISSVVSQVDDESAPEVAIVSQVTEEVDESGSLMAQVGEETAKETTEVRRAGMPVVTTQEVDESSELVAQVADESAPEVAVASEVTEEIAPEAAVVSEVTEEIAPEAAVASQVAEEVDESSALVSEIAGEIASEVAVGSQVAEEVDESSELVAQVEDEIAKETTEVRRAGMPVVTTPQEVDESSELVAQVDDEIAKETTEVRRAGMPVVTTPQEVDSSSELVAQVEDETAKETTEVRRAGMPVVTTQEVDESSGLVAQVEGESSALVSEVAEEVGESSQLLADVASETGHVSSSYTNGTAIGEPVVLDSWEVASQAWQAGKTKEAYAIYQSFFSESDEYDAQLDDALSAWTSGDDAPFLAFQLLGDVYRRMRRMQDAVKQYREAIKRI